MDPCSSDNSSGSSSDVNTNTGYKFDTKQICLDLKIIEKADELHSYKLINDSGIWKIIRTDIKSGKEYVAVLVSEGFGGGFSSWVIRNPDTTVKCIYTPDMVVVILKENVILKKNGSNDIAWGTKQTNAELELLAREHYPGIFTGGIKGLTVYWVRTTAMFRITEYDGSEDVEIFNPSGWHQPLRSE